MQYGHISLALAPISTTTPIAVLIGAEDSRRPTNSLEQQLIEAIRTLAPDKQRAVLDFAELLKSCQSPHDEAPLIKPSPVLVYETGELAERDIQSEQAAELRSCLQTFAEDWNRPEMAVYDEI